MTQNTLSSSSLIPESLPKLAPVSFCLQSQAKGAASKPPLRPKPPCAQSLVQDGSRELSWSGELSQELNAAGLQQQQHFSSAASSDSLQRPSPPSQPMQNGLDHALALSKRRSKSLPRNISTSSFDDYMIQSATSNGQLRKCAPLPPFDASLRGWAVEHDKNP